MPSLDVQYDYRVYLVQIGGTKPFGGYETYTKYRVLNTSLLMWTDYRYGGNGFLELWADDLFTKSSMDTIVLQEWEIWIDVTVDSGITWKRWYRGVIENCRLEVVAGKALTYFGANGYGFFYLARLGGRMPVTWTRKTVKEILAEMIGTIAGSAKDQSRIVWDADEVAGAQSIGKMTYDMHTLRLVQMLRRFQGETEWRIDPTSRKFQFKAHSTSVREGNYFVQGKDIFNIQESGLNAGGGNWMSGLGAPLGYADGGVFAGGVYADTTDAGNYGRKYVSVDNSSFLTATDLNRWAEVSIAEAHPTQTNTIQFDWLNVDRWINEFIPIGKITAQLKDPDGSSRKESLQMHSVIYSIGDLESVGRIGAQRQSTYRDRAWFSARVRLGITATSITEEIAKLQERCAWLELKNRVKPTVIRESRFRYYQSGDSGISSGVDTAPGTAWTKVFDEFTEFNASAGVGRFTALVAGYYLISATGWLEPGANSGWMAVRLHKNTDIIAEASTQFYSGGGWRSQMVTEVVYLDATDYVRMTMIQDSGDTCTIKGGTTLTRISGHWLSS